MTDRVTIDPGVCHGKPVIRGTRLPVTIVLGSIAGGMSHDEIIREYSITKDDIRSALEYAADLINEQDHHPLPS